MNKFEQIYALMNGQLDLENYPELIIPDVVNEFAEDMPCAQLYEEVYQAKCRLENRLGIDDDKDIETIISNLLEISELLSAKVFEYGLKSL